MNNYDEEIRNYVGSKQRSWSDTTRLTVAAKLITINRLGLEPQRLYTRLEKSGYGRYTIQNYFILARDFEEKIKRTKKIRQWMQDNRLCFKNCYKKKTRILSDENFQFFLSQIPNDNNLYNFLILMGKAGLRKSEALAARWSHINDNTLEVPSGKGGKQRFVPFKASWLRPIEGDTVVSTDFQCYYQMMKLCGEFTPHDFRSYYANRVVNMPGMSIEDARQLLGHEDIKTTASYLRADKDRQRKLLLEDG